jgi:hypothetical protein
MEKLKPQESEALDIIEAMLDAADVESTIHTGVTNWDKPIRSGNCRILADDTAKLRQYIADRRAAPENKALEMEQLRKMDGEPVWWWNKSDKPRLTICDSTPYKPDLLFISYDWVEDDTISITPYKRIIKWGYKPYARKPEGSES